MSVAALEGGLRGQLFGERRGFSPRSGAYLGDIPSTLYLFCQVVFRRYNVCLGLLFRTTPVLGRPHHATSRSLGRSPTPPASGQPL